LYFGCISLFSSQITNISVLDLVADLKISFADGTRVQATNV
jgi:hypothetical protein